MKSRRMKLIGHVTQKKISVAQSIHPKERNHFSN
jgi:hypothetical protein